MWCSAYGINHVVVLDGLYCITTPMIAVVVLRFDLCCSGLPLDVQLPEHHHSRLSKALAFYIAYAANTGGTGSPPNLVFKAVVVRVRRFP